MQHIWVIDTLSSIISDRYTDSQAEKPADKQIFRYTIKHNSLQ